MEGGEEYDFGMWIMLSQLCVHISISVGARPLLCNAALWVQSHVLWPDVCSALLCLCVQAPMTTAFMCTTLSSSIAWPDALTVLICVYVHNAGINDNSVYVYGMQFARAA